jgi:hypothetical protein
VRTAVLVEGESDRAAVLELAALRRAPLEAADVVAMGGITNVRRYVAELGGEFRLVGLYDAAEERFVRRALGRPDGPLPGWHRCEADLEEELIRALGAERVVEVVERAGDLASFHSLQRQPVQRSWTLEAQLHRFMGSGSGRKLRYARLLVRAAGEDAPQPLRGVVAAAT